MRVVIDTNVIVSGVFFHGTPSRLLQAWKSGDISLVVSPVIFKEYKEVLKRIGKKFPKIEVQPIIDLLTLEAEFVEAPKLKKQICADPDDDKFIACAIASKVRIIVSGDKALLDCSGEFGIPIVNPATFVASYISSKR